MQGIILIIYTYNDVIPQANPLTTRGYFCGRLTDGYRKQVARGRVICNRHVER